MYLALTLVPRDGAKAPPPPTHTHTLKSEPELTTFNAKREPKVQAVVRASNLIALASRPFEFRLATHVRAHSSSYVEQLGHSRSVQSFCVILPQVLVPHVPLRPYETSTLWTHNVDVADVEHSTGSMCALGDSQCCSLSVRNARAVTGRSRSRIAERQRFGTCMVSTVEPLIVRVGSQRHLNQCHYR